ncbi:MAG: hypothetical protein JXA36_04355, partial [Coriobacteriia bacterium]|nr:hypothetical protein [Coriobacteriia bacterium]
MTTAKLIRGGVRLVILALVVGLVSAAARESVAGLPVTIDGEQVLVRRGADVCDALGGMTEMPEGRILAASDSRVLAESSGMSGTVLLNGKAAPLSAVLHEGDCIET